MDYSEGAVMNKLISGRFWLAIMAGFALLMMTTWENPPTEAICSIIASVFVSYFGKREHDA